MRKVIATIAVLVLLCSPSLGDEVKVRDRHVYKEVRIFRVKDCEVTFLFSTKQTITKPLSELEYVRIDGQSWFNKAEKLLLKGEFSEALKAYDLAEETAPRKWMKELIRLRRLQVMDQCGMIEQAVLLWLEIVKENGASKNSLTLRPSKLGPKGSNQNSKVIAILEVEFKKSGSTALKTAIETLLLDLYKVEGIHKKASDLAKDIATRPVEADLPDAAEQGELAAKLKAAEVMVQEAEIASAAKALEMIESNLPKFSYSDHSAAYLLRGKARTVLAEKSKDEKLSRRHLLDAGLDFMRVVTYFPGSVEAPEALFEAGRVNLALKNFSAARVAFATVVSRYGKSSWATKASSVIGELKNK